MRKAGYDEEAVQVPKESKLSVYFFMSFLLALCFAVIAMVAFDYSRSGYGFLAGFANGIIVLTALFFSITAIFSLVFKGGWGDAVPAEQEDLRVMRRH